MKDTNPYMINLGGDCDQRRVGDMELRMRRGGEGVGNPLAGELTQ